MPELSHIDSDILPDDKPYYTQQRPVLCGSFNFTNVEIPFFQAILPLRNVVDELDLVENLPSDLRAKWRLEELFQREIDWERVEDQLVKGYLRRPGKLKFFSTLTVALLPLNEDGMLASAYGETSTLPDPINGATAPQWITTNVGGVQVVKNARGPNGYIRWDPKRIFAATIDGQHRLAALKTLAKSGGLPQRTWDTQVSVMFLVLDPRAGFTLGNSQVEESDNQILTVVREIFIDLNTNARTVARARSILLADQDIEARCLRELIARRIGVEEEGRLPLGLIHWQHNESAKFNIGEKTGPFITTVELLYLILRDVLALRRPADPNEATEVRRFVSSVEESLGVSAHIAANPLRFPDLRPLGAYVEENYLREGYEAPFANLTPPYIRACADSFSETWRPIFLNVFMKFQPYASFIEEVQALGGIDGDLAHYLVQPVKAQEAQRAEWGEELPQKLSNPLRKLHSMKDGKWPFYAVFQKALFRATKIAFQNYDVVPNNDVSFPEAWVKLLNKLAEDGLFEVRCKEGASLLWAGIGLNAGSGTVNWSEASAQRLAATLVLWWYFYAYRLKNAKQFLNRLDNTQSAGRFPQGRELAANVRGGLRGLIRSRSEEDIDPQTLKDLVEKRLREIVAIGKHTDATDDADAVVEALPVTVGEPLGSATPDSEGSEA